MKQSRLWLFLCLNILFATMLLSGCNGDTTETDPVENSISIALKDAIPVAYVDTSYDLFSAIIEEEDTEYSFTASYLDPASGELKELSAKRGKIKPKVEADISVTVTATKGTATETLDFTVPISISADILDKLLVSDGVAGEADTGVQKRITKNPEHLQSDTSTSSIEVTFTNPSAEETGANLMLLSHYSLHAYYSAQVWHNAAVSFWVYNPMEQAVTFKLSSYNPEDGRTLLWDSADNVCQQTAAPGQWTQLSFSLYDMGITQPLCNTPNQGREDFLKVLARFDGEGPCTVYIDSVDIVDANTLPDLQTGYIAYKTPGGNFSDLLNTCSVYTEDPVAKLTPSTNGNNSADSYCFGADQQIGYPVFHIDFPQVTDIRGFDYLKFDVYAEHCYPSVSATIRYIDRDGNVQKLGCSFDFKQNQWRSLFLNLHTLTDADLSQVVGISFSIHMDSHFEKNCFNCMYFDNVSLYVSQDYEPPMAPATTEDNDILSAPLFVSNTKPNVSGVCKVATDETGLQKSNSSVLFWANNVCGYPSATFLFDNEQDWSDYSILTFETHQVNAHYWMRFDILYLNEEGKQRTLTTYHDTIFNHWLITNAPFEWFQTEDGQSANTQNLERVIGFRITVDFVHNVTDEAAYIFFDNFELS